MKYYLDFYIKIGIITVIPRYVGGENVKIIPKFGGNGHGYKKDNE